MITWSSACSLTFRREMFLRPLLHTGLFILAHDAMHNWPGAGSCRDQPTNRPGDANEQASTTTPANGTTIGITACLNMKTQLCPTNNRSVLALMDLPQRSNQPTGPRSHGSAACSATASNQSFSQFLWFFCFLC